MTGSFNRIVTVLDSRDRMLTVGLLVMMLIAAMAEMVGVAAVPIFISVISSSQQVPGSSVVTGLLQHLVPSFIEASHDVRLAAAVLLLVFVIKNGYLACVSVFQAHFINTRQAKVATRLFAHYLAQDHEFHLRANSVVLLRNVTVDALDVIVSGLLPLLTLTMETLTVTAIIGLLFIVEPVVSAIAFMVLGLATFLFLRLIRARLHSFGGQMQDARGKMMKTVNEGLGSLKSLRLLQRQRFFQRRFESEARSFAEAGWFRTIAQDLPRLYLEVAALSAMVIVALVLSAQGRSPAQMIPTLALLAVAVVRMIPSFNKITSSLTVWRFGRQALEAVSDHASVLAEGTNDVVSHAPAVFARVLKMEDVEFCYEGALRNTLDNVSIEIPCGAAVAFVGPTGSGKTTCVDLLLGLLTPSAGRITVDGSDIRDNLEAWQAGVGYVPQDIYLVDDTISANVALGVSPEKLDHERLQHAVNAAQLRTFICTLPGGLGTRIGERGVRLSGGQRQRIGVARALYDNPSVLIFDEATSALDRETERALIESIEALRDGHTVITIAHRLSTVRACDTLFLLDGGRVVDRGSYDELVDRNSHFRSMAAKV